MKPNSRGRVIAIAGGKGGAGKTHLAVNVAVALTRLGLRAGVLDGSFGLGNVDVVLGLTPVVHLGHVLDGERTLSEATLEGPSGVRVVPSASGVRPLTALTAVQRGRLRSVVDELSASLDFLIIDAGSGVSDNVIETIALADSALVVTSLEPAAVVDAYATAKVLTSDLPSLALGLVVNGVRSSEEADLAFRQIEIAATRFLHRSMPYYGFIPEDASVREAALAQRAVVEHNPQAPASRAYRVLAAKLAGLGPSTGRTIDLEAALEAEEEISRCA